MILKVVINSYGQSRHVFKYQFGQSQPALQSFLRINNEFEIL